MNRFSKLLMAALIGVSMAACSTDTASGGAAEKEATVVTRKDVDVSDLEGVPAETGTDITGYLTDGTLHDEDILFNADGTVLTADEMSFELAYQMYDAFNYYSYYYGAAPELTDELQDGLTVAKYIGDFGAENSLAYASAEIIAKQNGVEMPETYQAEIDSIYDDSVEYYGQAEWASGVENGTIKEADFTEDQKKEWITEHGTKAFRNYLLYFGTTREGYETLVEKNYWYRTVQEQLFADGGKYALTDEVKAEETAKYIEENGAVWARCILFSTMNEGKDEATVLADAQKAYEELSALTGTELSEKFTEYQSQYDESGYTAGEVQMYVSTDSLVDGYYDGITVLKPGEVGITDKTAYGYFILLREEDQPADLEERIVSSYAANKLHELTQEVLDKYGVTKESLLEKIDITAYYTKLQELQSLIEAAETAAAEQ